MELALTIVSTRSNVATLANAALDWESGDTPTGAAEVIVLMEESGASRIASVAVAEPARNFFGRKLLGRQFLGRQFLGRLGLCRERFDLRPVCFLRRSLERGVTLVAVTGTGR